MGAKFNWTFTILLVFFHILLMANSGFSKEKYQSILIPPPPEISGGAATKNLKISCSVNSYLNNKYGGTELTSVTMLDPLLSFEAINFNEDAINNGNVYHIPPDPIGAAGPEHVVCVVNTSVEWYDKTGVRQNSQSLSSFFSSLNPLTQTFDPKVIYDQYANRFLVVALEQTDQSDGDPADTSRILLAVSATSDPNGSWYFHAEDSKFYFLNPTLHTDTDHWADYPGFAVDDQAVFITNNMYTFGASRYYGGSRLWIINKGIGSSGFYEGGTANVTVHDPYAAVGNAATTQPTHMFGSPPGNLGTFLVSYSGLTYGGVGGQELVQIIRIDNPLGSISFFHQYVIIGDIEDIGVPFGWPDLLDAPQADTEITVEVNDRRTLNAVWRNNALWISTTISPNSGPDSGQTTAHWWKMNTSNLSSISLSDQGNVGCEDIADSTYTFFPSLAVNANGDMAIGFSASAPSIYPGAYYTGRLSGDPAGTVQQSVALRAGLDYYYRAFGSSRNRWGDFSGASVDPSDDITFWVFNEYAIERGSVIPQLPQEDGRWGTAFGSFSLPLVPIVPGDSPTEIADKFSLSQNYPNPFNPITTIRYSLPKKSQVKILIFDILGEKVKTILNEHKSAGHHQVTFNAGSLTSGVYFYKIEADGFTEIKKMVLMK